MTGCLAAASMSASCSIPRASAVARIGIAAAAGAQVGIRSNRYSIGSDTNTGPRGAAIANWHARWMVEGKTDFALTPKLHLTQCSTRRAGPPISARLRSHCGPGSGPSSSPNAIDSPENTTIGTFSCSAPRIAMVPCRLPTVVWIITAGSFPLDLAYPLAMATAISSWRAEK